MTRCRHAAAALIQLEANCIQMATSAEESQVGECRPRTGSTQMRRHRIDGRSLRIRGKVTKV